MSEFRIRRIAVVLGVALLLAGIASGAVWNVPPIPRIQDAINLAFNGDTVSVWGPEGVPLPYTYQENIDFLGKSILVVNRSFLPGQTPGYEPSWDHVIIDGTQNGPTVKIRFTETATLKGFTVTGGFNDSCGGGITCLGGYVSVIENRVRGNATAFAGSPPLTFGGGGGIYFRGAYHSGIVIRGNSIEENTANLGCGGGICVYDLSCDYVEMVDNTIQLNTARAGGGIAARSIMVLRPPPATKIDSNVVSTNSVVPAVAPLKGGGMYCVNLGYRLRHNIVTDNVGNGIYAVVDGGGLAAAPDMGTQDDPGYNVLMRNGYGVVDASPHPSSPLCVVGNYWGSVNTATVLSLISTHNPGLQFDPVAASSKWFDVDLEPLSLCETGVLVTGDLRVSRSLTMSAGKKVEFHLSPDATLEGGDPNLTDFIVEGSGTVLTSFGTAEDTILYTSRRFPNDPWMAGDWYGIRVRDGAEALFYFSEIRAAYCGIDVASDGLAHPNRSKLWGCLFAGAYSQQGMMCVESCEVSLNEVYGVRYEMPGPGQHCYVLVCTLSRNGYAGVSFEGASASRAPHRITYNQVVGGFFAPFTPYGIEVIDGANWVSVENNDVSDLNQAGIALWASSPSFGYNTAHGNHVNGIAFFEGSNPDATHNNVLGNDFSGIACWASSPSLRHNEVMSNAVNGIACFEESNPYVRWNMVDWHQNGVYCEGSSYPDLGTVEDPGNNSILSDNVLWVKQIADGAIPLMAELNWWGTDRPDLHPEKFVGLIDYDPWLTSPPEGGGQQGAGIEAQPLVTGLDPLLPMPMRSTARIPLQVAHAGQVALSIVDASGRLVRALLRGEREPGRYSVTWDRTDDHGRSVPAGVYFCTLSAENKRFSRKVVLTE